MPIVLLILLTLGLGSCLEPSGGKNPPDAESGDLALTSPVVNRLRGYEVINSIVNQRLFDNKTSFKLISYLEEPNESLFSSGSALIKLLGAYDGNGLNLAYQGRQPNTVNMLLWHTVFSMLAEDLTNTCDPKTKNIAVLKALNAEFRSQLCTLVKSSGDLDDDAWKAVWQAIIATDAPDAEEALWLKFVEEQLAEGRTGKAMVNDALVAMLMNPYFLIAH